MNSTSQRIGSALLALGGFAFILSGQPHPAGTFLLLAMGAFAAGLVGLGARPEVPRRLRGLLSLTFAVTVLAAVGTAIHVLEGLATDATDDGGLGAFTRVEVVNQTVVYPVWALFLGALAVVGGITRQIGNPVLGALGLVGAVTFALASATAAWTDRFGDLFLVGALLGIWALLVGLGGLASLHGAVRVRSAVTGVRRG